MLTLKKGKWDSFFKHHLHLSKQKGIDINYSIEEDWGGTLRWLREYILPFIPVPEPVICEIGPGTGRFSRHLMANSQKYYLVDNSDFVIKVLKEMFRSQKHAIFIKSKNSDLQKINDNSVDFVFSISTFVHLYIEQIYGYVREFHRVLKNNGRCVVHFANIMENGGYDFFIEQLPKRKKFDRPSVFRFYHPEMIEKIAVNNGLVVETKKIIPNTRHCFIVLKKCK